MSSTMIPNVFHLEQRIQDYILAGSGLGLALALIDGDEIVYARGFGVTSVDDGGRPVTPQTLFHVASLSKTVLATLVLRLVDAGKLALDTPVVDYVPDFRFSDPILGRQITLRHLLSHTSGLPGAGKTRGPRDRDALQRYVWDQLATHSFVAEPGRVHLYSNTAITFAGYIAEVVTGQTYRDLVQELICTPLAMERTTYDHAVAMTYPLALPHEEVDGQLQTRHRWPDNLSGEPAGFLNSTSLDLANLAIVHLNAGQFRGNTFLSTSAVSSMHDRVIEIPKLGAWHPFAHMLSGYGLGLWTGTYGGERVIRHSGMEQSFNSFFDLLPDRRRGFVLLSNYDRGLPLIELVLRIYDFLLDRPHRGVVKVEPPPAPSDEKSCQASWLHHEGTYLSVGAGRLVTVRIGDGGLTLEEGESSCPLIAMSQNDYYAEDIEQGHLLVSFVPEPAAPTEYLYLGGTPYRRLVVDQSFRLGLYVGEVYAGHYRDVTNLDPTSGLQIGFQEGQLWLVGDAEREALVPFDRDRFLSSHGVIEFVVQDAGSVSALIVGSATRYERVTGPDGGEGGGSTLDRSIAQSYQPGMTAT